MKLLPMYLDTMWEERKAFRRGKKVDWEGRNEHSREDRVKYRREDVLLLTTMLTRAQAMSGLEYTPCKTAGGCTETVRDKGRRVATHRVKERRWRGEKMERGEAEKGKTKKEYSITPCVYTHTPLMQIL